MDLKMVRLKRSQFFDICLSIEHAKIEKNRVGSSKWFKKWPFFNFTARYCYIESEANLDE